MKLFLNPRWLLILMLIILCFSSAYGRRGGGSRGGGGRGSSSRGSSSRGSSSRGSSSGSNTSRGTTYDRNRDRGSSSDSNRSPPAPAPAPKPEPPRPKASVRPYVPSPAPAPKPSAPEIRQPAQNPNFKESPNQPAYNPNFKEQSPNQPASNPNYRGQNAPGNQQPPPYSPRENPPGYSPVGQQPPHSPGVAPPPYSAGGNQPAYAPGGVAPPPYSAQGPSYNPNMGVPNANYPRQPGSQGIPNANYPRQPGSQGMPNANYPRPPGYPAAPGSNYPSQGGVPGANYPRQPGGIPGANYPRQPPVAPNTLGARVWQPQSGMPAPAYMNYGGLPTGSNMYQKPLKKKGFLGSLMSMGSSSHKIGKKPKYYGSYPSPYGGGGFGGGGFGGGFGKHGGGFSGKSAAMYTILPYMAARKTKNVFKPRFGFMPIFLPSPFHHHHYHGYGGYGYGYHNHHYYDVYNNEYVGKCNRPITPKYSNISCNSTNREINCEARCQEGYRFPENTTSKENKCWHVTGVWRPTKNFPDCQPVCNQTCLNGGSCIGPDICGCPPEYRGPLCEHHFLKCDIRKLAGNVKIRWVCTHTKNGTTCKIKCKEDKEFEKPPPEEYKCTPDGTWTPPEVPLCIEPSIGDSLKLDLAKLKEPSHPFQREMEEIYERSRRMKEMAMLDPHDDRLWKRHACEDSKCSSEGRLKLGDDLSSDTFPRRSTQN